MKYLKYFLILAPYLSMAQATIEGKILIQENNETNPLAGVNIFWLDSAVGTVSNQEGDFSISPISSTNRLIIKYLGFKTDTLSVTPREKNLSLYERIYGRKLRRN
jgi:hypothetical protein